MEFLEHPKEFPSKDDEIHYWKDLVERLIEEKDFIQREFDDYTADSQQLEKEFEATIEQNEKTIRELRSNNCRAQNELESLKSRLDQANHENMMFESQVKSLKDEKKELQWKVRELEQKNDDLERAERMYTETVEAVKTTMNNVIERNAILESEVDEKETLKEKLQRLVDEARDLKQELKVKDRCPDNDRTMNGHSNNGLVDSNRLPVESQTQTTPVKRHSKKAILVDGPLSPSSRILALNIIGDLIRKVGLSRFLCEHCGQVNCSVCPSPAIN
ncbi:PREDICTED: nuclear distribution protein nudE-like 1-B [Nicrophorus vespilloides]|uniref:Nuclear distribution protein nudE-like 1-B n=1 Tax=Nicrophorus vespilloides TaxID=110193 RepID=A0ABM1MPF0_NICVS|nr:PREDICTED: nuclear distribution protein nudE-like 1-B [Nicrophorus vespilloides]